MEIPANEWISFFIFYTYNLYLLQPYTAIAEYISITPYIDNLLCQSLIKTAKI